NQGNALMGTGRATGDNRAVEAAQTAVSSPLLEDISINGAEGVLVNITGGRDLTLHEVNEAAGVVVSTAGEDANGIFGAVIDPNMDGEIQITVVATGFGRKEPRLSLIDGKTKAAAPAIEALPTTDRQTPAYLRYQKTGRGDNGRTDSLDVPTFLRRQ